MFAHRNLQGDLDITSRETLLQFQLCCHLCQMEMLPAGRAVKGRHGNGNKGNFESGQYTSKACSNILEDRESSPLFVTME